MKNVIYKCELIYKCEVRDTEQYSPTNSITVINNILFTN